MGQEGRFFIPPVANSSLGWTASFTLKLSSGVGLVWGNTGTFVDPIVVQGSRGGNIGGNANYRFMAWLIDTYGTLVSGRLGFFIVNSTGVRTASASQSVSTLPTSQAVSATVFAAWNPQRGATFRSTGFATNVNFSDIHVVHSGNDAHSWMFIGETGELAEFAAIDDVVIEAPCGDCERDGNVCIWNAGGQFTCNVSTPAPTLKPSPAPTPAVAAPTMIDWSTAAGLIAGGVVGALLLLTAVSAFAVYMTRKYHHQARTDAVTATTTAVTQIEDNGDDSNGEGPVYAPIEEPRQSTMDIPLPSVVRDMYVALPPESSQYANRPPLRTSEHTAHYDVLARHEIEGK